MQQITIIGNVSMNRSEMKYTQNGKAVMTISVAVNRRSRDGNEEPPTWYRVSLWSGQAEAWDGKLRDRVKAVAVTGELEVREFTRNDNTVGYSLDIPFPHNVEVVAWKNDTTEDEPQPARRNRPTPVAAHEGEGDMPF
jgi:single stranded DNA-binding protein